MLMRISEGHMDGQTDGRNLRMPENGPQVPEHEVHRNNPKEEKLFQTFILAVTLTLFGLIPKSSQLMYRLQYSIQYNTKSI